MAGMCACSERGERGVRRMFGVSRVSRVGGGEGFCEGAVSRGSSSFNSRHCHQPPAGGRESCGYRSARCPGKRCLCVSPPTATARLPAPPGPRRALVGPLLRPCRHTGSTMTHHLQRHFLLEPTIEIHPRFILAHSLHTHTRTHTLRTAATNAALRSPTDSSLFQADCLTFLEIVSAALLLPSHSLPACAAAGKQHPPPRHKPTLPLTLRTSRWPQPVSRPPRPSSSARSTWTSHHTTAP